MAEVVAILSDWGLHPELLFAGASGGWLALTYQEQTTFWIRSRRVLLSALAATWCTPLVIHLASLPSEPPVAKFPVALARMTPETHLAVRLAIWTTMVGAVARVWWIANGGVPDHITVLMLIAFALLISCERRLQVLTRRARRPDSYIRK